MPLVRYEVRCEHSLANPELYRSAARDDPEGLLEGVAMAGLVGIVRQLGDLAEFAAEIFRDLHDELMAIGGRGHDLTARVQQLEAELPAVEKALLSEPNQLRFAYSNGADWHASIRSDQNHCTQGDLPRFVRNFYEECRGPPRLFLLDKFDVAGAGACLKRYTDPSFFKLEWASSELMKAQRAQRDKKARREKKKGRRRRTGQPIAGINQLPSRVRYGSASLEDLDGLPQTLTSSLKVGVQSLAQLPVTQGAGVQLRKSSTPTPKVMLSEDSTLPTLKSAKVIPIKNEAVREGQSEPSKPLKISAKDIETTNSLGKFYWPSDPEGVTGSMPGRISEIIDMEDRDAAPFGAQFSTKINGSSNSPAYTADISPVETKVSSRISRNDLEAAAMARTGRTSRGNSEGNSRGNFLDVTDVPNHAGNEKVSRDDFTDGVNQARVLRTASRGSSMDIKEPAQLAGKQLRKSSVDGNGSATLGSRYSRQISMDSKARSASDGDNFVDAPSTMDSEGDSDFEARSAPVASVNRGIETDGDSRLNHTALKAHVEAQQHFSAEDVDPMEVLGSLSPIEISSQAMQGVIKRPIEQPMSDFLTDAPSLDHTSPVSAILNEGPPSSSNSSGKSDMHGGDLCRSDRQSAEDVSREEYKGAQENAESRPQIPALRGLEIPGEYGEESQMLSLMATSPRGSSLQSSSSAPSPVTPTPGQHRLQPSVPNLSRHSTSPVMPTPGQHKLQLSISNLSRNYSGRSLMSVSSNSAPPSPTSPASNTLYSPPGSPGRNARDLVDSPPGLYSTSYLPVAHEEPPSHHSDIESPSATEIPGFSLSPTSPLHAYWEGLSDQPGPLNHSSPPTRPPPIIVLAKAKSTPSPSQTGPQFYRLPSPPVSPEPNLSQSARLKDLSIPSSEGVSRPPSPQQDMERFHSHNPVTSPDLGLHPSPTSRSEMGLPSLSPTAYSEPVKSPVIHSESVPSSPPQSSTPTPSFTNSVRTSLIPPPGSAESPSSRPVSPKRTFSPISLTSPAVISTPSLLGNLVMNATPSPSVEAEESSPSSPSGSVIIKDTPSPPASPASSCSESEPESPDFTAPPNQPPSPRSYGQDTHSIINEDATEQEVPETSPLEGPMFDELDNAPTSTAQNIPHSPSTTAQLQASKQPQSADQTLQRNPLESAISNVPLDHEVTQQKSLLHSSPPVNSELTFPALNPKPETTYSSPLPPILTTRSSLEITSVSESPPASAPKGNDTSSIEGTSNLQWRGRSKPSSPLQPEVMLPPTLTARSPSNSPPNSPPRSVISESSSQLKWRGRDLATPPKPDFSLPPNLAPQSESSSPPCSPPPRSESNSPQEWVTRSADSSSRQESPLNRQANAGLYHNPDSPFRTESPEVSDETNLSPQIPSRHDYEEDRECELGEHHEAEALPSSLVRSGGFLPSSSSAESLIDLPSRMPGRPEEAHVPGAETNLPPIEESNTEPRPKSSESILEATEDHPSDFVHQSEAGHPLAAIYPPGPPPAPERGSRMTLNTRDALAAAIAQSDRNMLKVLTFQEPVRRPLPPPDKREILLEEIRTKSFNLRRTDNIEKEAAPRPLTNINVAAILEKAKNIRQAIGSDEDDDDDWSDT